MDGGVVCMAVHKGRWLIGGHVDGKQPLLSCKLTRVSRQRLNRQDKDACFDGLHRVPCAACSRQRRYPPNRDSLSLPAPGRLRLRRQAGSGTGCAAVQRMLDGSSLMAPPPQ